MTDRPTHPLTKEQYELIVAEAGMRPDTVEFFIENYDLLNTTTHKMAIDAACNASWGGSLRAWTDDGKRAIDAVVTAVACCASYHIEAHMVKGHYMPSDSYKGLRALVGNRYRAWRSPSETYMCM
jgi:hypothetical protein